MGSPSDSSPRSASKLNDRDVSGLEPPGLRGTHAAPMAEDAGVARLRQEERFGRSTGCSVLQAAFSSGGHPTRSRRRPNGHGARGQWIHQAALIELPRPQRGALAAMTRGRSWARAHRTTRCDATLEAWTSERWVWLLEVARLRRVKHWKRRPGRFTLISTPSRRRSLRESARTLGVFSVGRVYPLGVHGAASAGWPIVTNPTCGSLGLKAIAHGLRVLFATAAG